MSPANAEVPYGTLDLMVLKTLAAMGPQHGYGIARRIEQAANGALALNQGTIYPALLRLEQKGWISATGGRARTIAGRGSTPSRRPGGSSSRPKRACGHARCRW